MKTARPVTGSRPAVPRGPDEVRVDGQDEAPDPAQRAHEMRVAGRSWTQIAAQLGYPTGGDAQLAHSVWVQKVVPAATPQLAQAEYLIMLDRLSALHAAFWPKAQAGDVSATRIVLSIMGTQVKVLTQDALVAEAAKEPPMLVISQGPDMAAHLQRVAIAQETERVRNGADDRKLQQMLRQPVFPDNPKFARPAD